MSARPADGGRRPGWPLRHLALAVLALLAWAGAAGAAPPRVTVFGDSVQASFLFSPRAVDHLRRGIDLQLQASTCRKLTSPGCLGGSPESVLTVASALGRRLGDVVVVNVGYNDSAGAYDIETILRVLTRARVKAVIWVTLREADSGYVATNALIRRTLARRRGPRAPIIRIADWNAASAGRPWFVSDGIHLNTTGAQGLAELLRGAVVSTLADLGVSVPGAPAVLATDRFPVGPGATAIAGDGGALWVRRGGSLVEIDPATGAPRAGVAQLTRGEVLTSDGRQAWVMDADAQTATRAERRVLGIGFPPVEGVGTSRLLARSGARLWTLRRCPPGDVTCTSPDALLRVTPTAQSVEDVGAIPGQPGAMAADATALWVLTTDPASGRPVLERRNPDTGRLARATTLPPAAAGGSVVAGRGAAWVRTRAGELLRVRRTGRATRVMRAVRAVAAQGDQLWVLRDGGRAFMNLHPVTGRVRGQARPGGRLSGRITLTAGHVWILSASGREVLRLRRR